MRWLALILPELALQTHLRGLADPGAIAVTDPGPPVRVLAASPAARLAGIQPGLSVSAALAMLPGLQLRPRDRVAEQALLQEVACWAGAYTPCLSLDPPDGIVLDIAASLKLFGGADAIERALHEGLRHQGLQISTAQAPTPLAARWLARCTDQALPDASANWHARLDALPLGLLADGSDVSHASLALLADIGLRTLGEVRKLPRAGLARRQASAVTHTLARAYGETPDLRAGFVPPPTYRSHLPLSWPTVQVEPLLFASRRLIAGLCGWLAARHAGIDHCRLVLIHERGGEQAIDILTGTPGRDEAQLNLLVREHLGRIELSQAIDSLAIEAHEPRPLAQHVDDLFGDPASTGEHASMLVDRLRARLGRESVRQLRSHNDYRPERASQHVPLDPRPARSAPTAASLPRGDRPLCLLAQARRIADPTRLRLLRGPERIESGWWDGADIRRDYYLAETPDAARWWIFQELDPPRAWFVHGYFA